MRSRARNAALAALTIVVAGCGGPAPSPAPAASAVAPSPVATAATAAPSSGVTSGSITVDPDLLEALPGSIDDVARQADDETAAEIAASAELAPSVDGLAVGLYVGPGADGAEDLAIASIARLRAGVFSEAWFRAWRDTYDEAACEPAGGRTTGSAEVELGGRTAYVGTCRNGAHTYHVRLTDPDRVIAITSVGAGRFGERIVDALEE